MGLLELLLTPGGHVPCELEVGGQLDLGLALRFGFLSEEVNKPLLLSVGRLHVGNLLGGRVANLVLERFSPVGCLRRCCLLAAKFLHLQLHRANRPLGLDGLELRPREDVVLDGLFVVAQRLVEGLGLSRHLLQLLLHGGSLLLQRLASVVALELGVDVVLHTSKISVQSLPVLYELSAPLTSVGLNQLQALSFRLLGQLQLTGVELTVCDQLGFVALLEQLLLIALSLLDSAHLVGVALLDERELVTEVGLQAFDALLASATPLVRESSTTWAGCGRSQLLPLIVLLPAKLPQPLNTCVVPVELPVGLTQHIRSLLTQGCGLIPQALDVLV